MTIIQLLIPSLLTASPYVIFLHILLLFLLISIFYLIRKKNKINPETIENRFLHEILDNLPFPIFIKDINDNYKFIFWNKTTEQLTGVPREQILGKTDFDLYTDYDRAKAYRELDEMIVEKDEVYNAEEDYLTQDGRVLNSVMIKSVIKQNNHNLWLLSARWDITQVKENELKLRKAQEEIVKAVRKQNLALKSIDFGLVYINKDYEVLWESTDNVTYLDVGNYYKPGEICYKTARNRTEPCEGCPFKVAIEEGKTASWITKWGNVDVEITANPTYKDETKQELIGGLLRVDDITEKLKFGRMLQEAKEKAEESNRLKSAFLANMSHEIRTPLNAIVGFSALMTHAETQEEKDQYQEIIETNNSLLLQLINDILDLSKIEAGTLDFFFADTPIYSMFDNIHQLMLLKNDSPDVKIIFEEYNPDLVLFTDRSRLSQVTINLLTNAVKFTKKGCIALGYRLINDNNDVYFYVKDTGIGISADKLDSVFGRFVKLNDYIKGTGLGLSISKIIVEKLKGTIGVSSEEGKGSEFWFTLPVKSE